MIGRMTRQNASLVHAVGQRNHGKFLSTPNNQQNLKSSYVFENYTFYQKKKVKKICNESNTYCNNFIYSNKM